MPVGAWQRNYRESTLGILAYTNGDSARVEAELDARRRTGFFKLFSY
jgi:hypothetical protein